jgi:hypothetical protein
LLKSGGFFIHGLPTLPLQGINSDSAGNNQLIGEESTKEWFFRRELLAQRLEIHPRNGILPGITSSWKLIQASKIKMYKKSSNGNQFRISNYNSYILRMSAFKKIKVRKHHYNKKINLIRHYHEVHS